MVYVTSDLHGYPLEKFKELLNKAKFSLDDKCYILGDVIDRGGDGIKLLRWIMGQPNIELIRGNHEDMLLSCEFVFEYDSISFISDLTKNEMDKLSFWVDNGARNTIDDILSLNHKTGIYLLDFLKKTPLYKYITVGDKKFYLTHSGLKNFSKTKKISDYTPEELLWNRPSINDEYYEDVITVFGHTPTMFLDSNSSCKALMTKTWIDIDTGSGCGLTPTLLRLNDFKEYQLVA